MKTRMRKIVIISYKFPPVNSGYGNQAYSVLKSIVDNSDDYLFIVLTTRFKNKNFNDANPKIKIRYFRNNLLPTNTEKSSVINSAIFQLQIFLWLLINGHQYNLIHCLALGPHYALVVIVGKLLKKKVIIKIVRERFFNFYEHFLPDKQAIEHIKDIKINLKEFKQGNLLKVQYNNLLRFIIGVLLKKILVADVIIAISESIYNQLLNYDVGSNRIVRIPNGVDGNKYFPVKSKQEKYMIRRKHNLEEDAVIILFAGVLSYIKGIQDLVKAVKLIKSKNNIILLICGQNLGFSYDLTKSLEDINELKNIKAIYKGQVNNMCEYYRAADVFVLPSYIEGLPNVLLEAAMSGLPLIASDIGGNRDIIKEGSCGFLFPPGDIELLMQALQSMVNDRQLRKNWGEKARLIACEKYHLTKIVGQYLKLYREL